MIQGAPVNVFDFMSSSQIAYVQGGPYTAGVYLAIQAAVNAAPSVYLPAGTYNLLYGIELPSNCTLTGAGKFSTIIRAQDLCLEKNTGVPVDGLYPGGLFKSTNKTNIQITNLCIDGNFAGQIPTVYCNNVQFTTTPYVTIDNCRSINSMQESLLFNGSRHCSVTNCITENNQYSGINTAIAPNFVYVDLYTPDYASQSEYFTCTDNVSIGDGWRGGGTASAYSINNRYSVISNNSIYNGGLTGITLGHDSDGVRPPHDASYCTVTGNTIDGASFTNQGDGSGINIAFTLNGLVVDANTVVNTYGYGIIKAQVVTARCNNFVISNNLVSNSTHFGISIGGASGYSIIGNTLVDNCKVTASTGEFPALYIAGAGTAQDHNSNISNNTITNNGTAALTGTAVSHGIYVESAYNVTIVGNTVMDTRSGSLVKMTKGLTMLSTVRSITVKDNVFMANSIYIPNVGITLDATSNTLTRSAGNWITDGINSGQSISLNGFANQLNNATYYGLTVTALVLTYTTVNTVNPANETASVDAYASTTSPAVPYITNAGKNCIFIRNRLSPYPTSGFFTLTNGSTYHRISNPNLTSSASSRINLMPASAGAATRFPSLWQDLFSTGSVALVTSAAGTADNFFYEVV